MKKETYLKQAEKLKNEIDAKKNELIALRKDYIEKNKEFNVDDKVEITTPARKGVKILPGKTKDIPETKRLAFIKGFDVRTDGSIRCKLLKAKKDGSKSKFSDYHHYGEIIKLVKDGNKEK